MAITTRSKLPSALNASAIRSPNLSGHARAANSILTATSEVDSLRTRLVQETADEYAILGKRNAERDILVDPQTGKVSTKSGELPDENTVYGNAYIQTLESSLEANMSASLINKSNELIELHKDEPEIAFAKLSEFSNGMIANMPENLQHNLSNLSAGISSNMYSKINTNKVLRQYQKQYYESLKTSDILYNHLTTLAMNDQQGTDEYNEIKRQWTANNANIEANPETPLSHFYDHVKTADRGLVMAQFYGKAKSLIGNGSPSGLIQALDFAESVTDVVDSSGTLDATDLMNVQSTIYSMVNRVVAQKKEEDDQVESLKLENDRQRAVEVMFDPSLTELEKHHILTVEKNSYIPEAIDNVLATFDTTLTQLNTASNTDINTSLEVLFEMRKKLDLYTYGYPKKANAIGALRTKMEGKIDQLVEATGSLGGLRLLAGDGGIPLQMSPAEISEKWNVSVPNAMQIHLNNGTAARSNSVNAFQNAQIMHKNRTGRALNAKEIAFSEKQMKFSANIAADVENYDMLADLVRRYIDLRGSDIGVKVVDALNVMDYQSYEELADLRAGMYSRGVKDFDVKAKAAMNDEEKNKYDHFFSDSVRRLDETEFKQRANLYKPISEKSEVFGSRKEKMENTPSLIKERFEQALGDRDLQGQLPFVNEWTDLPDFFDFGRQFFDGTFAYSESSGFKSLAMNNRKAQWEFSKIRGIRNKEVQYDDQFLEWLLNESDKIQSSFVNTHNSPRLAAADHILATGFNEGNFGYEIVGDNIRFTDRYPINALKRGAKLVTRNPDGSPSLIYLKGSGIADESYTDLQMTIAESIFVDPNRDSNPDLGAIRKRADNLVIRIADGYVEDFDPVTNEPLVPRIDVYEQTGKRLVPLVEGLPYDYQNSQNMKALQKMSAANADVGVDEAAKAFNIYGGIYQNRLVQQVTTPDMVQKFKDKKYSIAVMQQMITDHNNTLRDHGLPQFDIPDNYLNDYYDKMPVKSLGVFWFGHSLRKNGTRLLMRPSVALDNISSSLGLIPTEEDMSNYQPKIKDHPVFQNRHPVEQSIEVLRDIENQLLGIPD